MSGLTPLLAEEKLNQREAVTCPYLPLSEAGWGGSSGSRAQAPSQAAVTLSESQL